jgi:hypothetical protein
MKTYIVSIGECNFHLSADNIKQAREKARTIKKLERMKGITIVRLAKNK